eukprot:13146554-Ditylum_brightwellii.AAC.1
MSESDDNATLALSSPLDDEDCDNDYDIDEENLCYDDDTVLLEIDDNYYVALYIDEVIGLIWWSNYYWAYTRSYMSHNNTEFWGYKNAAAA